MELSTLQIIWFLLIGVLFTGYAILDGFDLGIGILHLFSRNEEERQTNINAIGPFWDGNEVWLITGGGALFAAFPIVYATVFSGFYLAFMLVLVALIFRAVSLEFRNKVESGTWRRFWDYAFGLGSLLAAFLFGVALGNVLRGVPINQDFMFAGSFIGLLNPFSLLAGVLTVLMFIRHGALFLALKTDGEYRDRTVKRSNISGFLFILFYLITTVFALRESPFLFENLVSKSLFITSIVILFISIISIPINVRIKRYHRGFIASSISIIAIMALNGISLFPRIVPSSINLDYSLTIQNASSTSLTLTTMLIIAVIGMPIVIFYQAYIYWIFRGKSIITEDNY